MKKILAVMVLVCMMLTIVSCSLNKKKYEEDFIGTWVTGNSSGTMNILYDFEKVGDVYKGSSMTRNNGNDGYYEIDKYEATDKTITIYGAYGKMEYEYSFKDGDLYLDDMRFKKMD
ncbi:MAG: hypothetical protein IKW04_02105 [Clostridia bacterium]|nr:hypothetical protein [Clostridia bacterium]